MLLARPNRMQPIYFAFKLKDGLFIGDGQSPNQLDFLLANKIGTIVNCAASEVTVQHQLDGIRIINFEWLDSDDEVILDASDSNFHSICHFIDDAHAKHEGVLVCSLRGQSRALTIITAYLIKKYKWSLYKTLEYLNSKRNDFEIRANFLKQLVQLEARLFGKKLKNCTKNWQEEEIEQEGQIVKNTYLNSLMSDFPERKSGAKESKEKEQRGISQGKVKKSVKFNDFAMVIAHKPELDDPNEDVEEKYDPSPEPAYLPPKHKQQEMNILELNRVIEKQLKQKDQHSPRKTRQPKRSKTEMDDEPLSKIESDSSSLQHIKAALHQRTGNRREKMVVTPYRIRRNSEKSDKLKTQPKEDVQFNINLNINSINIIQQPSRDHSNQLKLDQQNSNKRSKNIVNQQKLKMYLNSNLANIARRRRESLPKDLSESRKIRSSSSKRLSADLLVDSANNKPPPRRKLSFFQSAYGSKRWGEGPQLH